MLIAGECKNYNKKEIIFSEMKLYSIIRDIINQKGV